MTSVAVLTNHKQTMALCGSATPEAGRLSANSFLKATYRDFPVNKDHLLILLTIYSPLLFLFEDLKPLSVST